MVKTGRALTYIQSKYHLLQHLGTISPCAWVETKHVNYISWRAASSLLRADLPRPGDYPLNITVHVLYTVAWQYLDYLFPAKKGTQLELPI